MRNDYPYGQFCKDCADKKICTNPENCPYKEELNK